MRAVAQLEATSACVMVLRVSKFSFCLLWPKSGVNECMCIYILCLKNIPTFLAVTRESVVRFSYFAHVLPRT